MSDKSVKEIIGQVDYVPGQMEHLPIYNKNEFGLYTIYKNEFGVDGGSDCPEITKILAILLGHKRGAITDFNLPVFESAQIGDFNLPVFEWAQIGLQGNEGKFKVRYVAGLVDITEDETKRRFLLSSPEAVSAAQGVLVLRKFGDLKDSKTRVQLSDLFSSDLFDYDPLENIASYLALTVR